VGNWLPGLRQWFCVADYRLGQLRQVANVSLCAHSEMSADDVLAFGADHAVIATRADWTTNLVFSTKLPTEVTRGKRIYTPHDLAAGMVIGL
jgi:dimethylamine/trimethylamine dehydrogenase